MAWHVGMVDDSTGNLQNVGIGSSLAITGDVLDTVGGPGGSLSATEYEADWGNNLTLDDFKTFIVTDAGVSATSKILLSLSYEAATGRDQDENEMDTFTLSAAAAAGSFTLAMHSLNGPAHGAYKIVYAIAA